MAIAVAGQSGYNDWGEEAILTEEFLAKDHKTWESGKVSINHENNNNLLGKATIKDLEFDTENGLVWATFQDLPEKALDLINSDFYEGLSQECIPLEFDGNKILKGYGLGVTIVTYPYTPAATPAQGVGVRPTASMLAAISSKYPEFSIIESKGGETTPKLEEELESANEKIKVLESSLEEIKSTNTRLQQELTAKDNTIEATVEKAVRAALESHNKSMREASEYEGAVKELSSFMKSEDLEEFLKEKPAVGIIRATAAAMKSSVASHIGTGNGSGNGKGGSVKATSIYEAGKDLYKAAGLTAEDLEKYGDVE